MSTRSPTAWRSMSCMRRIEVVDRDLARSAASAGARRRAAAWSGRSPWSAASIAARMRLAARSSLRTSCSTSCRLPITTISRLLKSCAMPPVSWPTASIFWACRYLRFEQLRSVMHWQVPKIASTAPCGPRSGSMIALEIALLAGRELDRDFDAGTWRAELGALERFAEPFAVASLDHASNIARVGGMTVSRAREVRSSRRRASTIRCRAASRSCRSWRRPASAADCARSGGFSRSTFI